VTDVKRYLEVCFAHKRLLMAPLLAALIGTAAYIFVQPPSYLSSATLWVNGNGVGTQSAAQTQADIVNQYLKTNSFAVSVAQNSPLGGYLDTHGSGTTSRIEGLFGGGGTESKASADTIRLYLGAHVTLTPLGPSELTLVVNAPTPQVANGTALALISQLTNAEISARTTAIQAQLALYKSQLADQAKELSTDLDAVRAYLAAHPSLANNSTASSTDAQLAILQDKAAQDRANYSALLAQIDKTNSDLALARQSQPFRVVDAPKLPSSVSLFARQELLAIAAGMLAGMLAVVGTGALLVRMDTTIHSQDEVQTMIGLPVIGSTPLSARA